MYETEEKKGSITRRPFDYDYQHDFYTCSHELEQIMIQNVLDKQAATGDLF